MKRVQFFLPTLFVCILAFTTAMAHSPTRVRTLSPTVSTGPGTVNLFTVPPGSLDYYYTTPVPNGAGTICRVMLFGLDDVSFTCALENYNTVRSDVSYTYFENSPVWRQANFTISGAGGVADVQIQWGTSYQVSVSIHWH